MHAHLSALALTLLVYAGLALSCLGWGFAAARVLRLPATSAMTLAWLGWAVQLLVLQVLHLAVPLNAVAVGPVFLIGIAFVIPRVVAQARAFHCKPRGILRVGGLLVVAVTVAAWIASRSMLSPRAFDTGLYHLNTIRWINSFPIVPGLGNLHGRLAFNQSFFTYAASLDIAPLFANGSRIANSFLLLLAAATFLARLRPVAARPSLLWESHPFEHLPSLFALPVLAHIALFSPGLFNPTPDLSSEVLQLVMFVMLARVARRWPAGEEVPLDETAVLALLGATAITIKLSNLAFSVTVMAISIGLACRARSAHRTMALATVVLIVWIARGYVLSGVPLYPSTIGHVAVDWAVPRDVVAQEARQIRGFAREPGEGWSRALDNRTWLHGWIRRAWVEKASIVAPVVAGVGFLAATSIVTAMRPRRRRNELVILVPLLAGLAYWFLTAPDPRFAHALFFCFAIAAALLFLAVVQPWASPRHFALILCAVFAITHLGLALKAVKHRSAFMQVSVAGWQPIPRVRVICRTTASGLVVLVPAEGGLCWDAPLPCTPYSRDELRARVPGRLKAGFAVTPPR